ncbi:MAG: hypothetical protein ACTSVV_04310 [Promethearchaeota archaeon]
MYSEIKNEEWNFNTLKPPLKINHILKDIINAWNTYREEIPSLKRRFAFIFLRILQRISYNLGWVIYSEKYLKNIHGDE